MCKFLLHKIPDAVINIQVGSVEHAGHRSRARPRDHVDHDAALFECFEDVLVIDEFNVEEVNAHQLKYFARGVGNILVDWSGDDETQEELELGPGRTELAAEEVRSAFRALDTLVGRVDVEALLDEIFLNFCLGK